MLVSLSDFFSPPSDRLQRLDQFRVLWSRLDAPWNLREVAGIQQSLLPLIDALLKTVTESTDVAWLSQLQRALADSSQRAATRLKALEWTANQCQEFADMDFSSKTLMGLFTPAW